MPPSPAWSRPRAPSPRPPAPPPIDPMPAQRPYWVAQVPTAAREGPGARAAYEVRRPEPAPRSQKLVPDRAVHVGAQPAAQLVEELPPPGLRAPRLPVQSVLEPQPRHMGAEPDRLGVFTPAGRFTPADRAAALTLRRAQHQHRACDVEAPPQAPGERGPGQDQGVRQPRVAACVTPEGGGQRACPVRAEDD